MSAAGSYAAPNVDDERIWFRPPEPDDDPPPARWRPPLTESPEGVAHSRERTATASPAANTSAATPDAVTEPDPGESPDADQVDLSALTIAGITRRHVGWAAAALVSVWIIVIFARQSGEAATAANRADQITRDNAALAAEVAALEKELQVIERPEYVSQMARAYRMGSSREIPFTLDRSVPEPGPDAPGSAALRVGAAEKRISPLESWLSLLFGPTN